MDIYSLGLVEGKALPRPSVPQGASDREVFLLFNYFRDLLCTGSNNIGVSFSRIIGAEPSSFHLVYFQYGEAPRGGGSPWN